MTSTAVIIFIGVVIVCYLLTCWALIDVFVKDFGSMEKKAVWGVVAFIPFIGWMVYLLWGRNKGRRREDKTVGQ